MSPLGFKARVGSALFVFCGGECNVYSLRSTSSVTPANFLMARMAAQLLLYIRCSADIGIGSVSNGQSPVRKTNVLPLRQRPGLNKLESCVFIFVHCPSCSSIHLILNTHPALHNWIFVSVFCWLGRYSLLIKQGAWPSWTEEHVYVNEQRSCSRPRYFWWVMVMVFAKGYSLWTFYAFQHFMLL